MPDLAKGDRVSWSAGRTTAEGTITRVITRRATVGGRTVAASAKDPRYVVRDATSGKTSVRKGDSLRPTAAAKKKAPAKKKPAAKKKAAAKKKPSAKEKPAAPTAKRFAVKPGAGRLRVPRPRIPRSRPKAKVLAAAGLAVLVVVAGILYFTQMPGRAADTYREDAAPAFEKVDDSLYGVFETFRAPYFRGLAIKELQRKRLDESNIAKVRKAFAHQYKSDAQALAKGKQAVDAAEDAIDDAEPDLTEVDAPPLLSGRGDLKQADDDADAAAEYLDDARDFLTEYRDLMNYASKSLAGERETTNAVLDEAPDDPDSASLETVKQSLSATLVRLRRAKKKFAAAGKGTEDAAPFRRATGDGIDLTIDYYAKLHKAFEDLSIGLFREANKEFERRIKRYGVRVFTDFAHLQSSSPISDSLGKLEDEEDSLAEKLGVEEGEHSNIRGILPPSLREGDAR